MSFKSIAARIFFLVIPTVLVTVISFVTLSYINVNTQNEQIFDKHMNDSLNTAEWEIRLELHKNEDVALLFASYAAVMKTEQFSHDKHEKVLKDNILSNKNTFGGGIWFEPYTFDPSVYAFGPFLYKDYNDNTHYIPNYGDTVDYFHENWYRPEQAAQSKELYWSDLYTDPVSGATMITASKPFYGSEGEFLGLGTADMNLENIRSIVNNIHIGNTGKAFILGSKGEYITFPNNEKSAGALMQYDTDDNLAALGRTLTSNSEGNTLLNWNERDYRVYYLTMPDVQWTLVVIVEENEINKTAMSDFFMTVAIPLFGLMLVILGVFSIVRYLRSIIGKVNVFANMAALGDFTKRIDVTEKDEFGFMETQLNLMITNMSEMSRQSSELIALAEKASRSKGDFLSRMSHEIRTPMNAIIGMSHIAKQSGDPERVRDCLAKIENASKHLLALINDVLDMSKIEANKLELCDFEFNLEKTIENVQSIIGVKAEEKGLHLEMIIDPRTPLHIIGDELRLSQVITNLLGNAVKFTPEYGTISLTVEEADRQDGEVSILHFIVRDSGIGMTPEQQSRLFQSFEQGDGSVTRKYGGTGLGLVICKRIVELMGGEIWVQSEPDVGSAFHFTIRVKRGDGSKAASLIPAAAKMSRAAFRNLYVLAVDDSPEANEYLRHILNYLHIRADFARDGAEAMNAVYSALARGVHYDVVFMDYAMPGINGIETAKRIREVSDSSPLFIMVSIYDWKDICEEAEKEGIHLYITKPCNPLQVADCLNKALTERLRGKHQSREEGYDFRGHAALIVEDVEINREIVKSFLQDTGLLMDFAENGQEALKLFSKNMNQYDLVLMDVQMPVMDGIEATRRIRLLEPERARMVPIIAMTANALNDDVVQCLEAGMDDHISKPLDPEVFLEKVSEYIL